MKHITAGWLESAKSDLDTIEEILGNDQLSHVVVFHSQQCIENNQIPETDGNEGLRVLQILQASQESLSSDGRKLSINEWQ